MSHVLASSIFWAAVAVCAIAQLAIARSALRTRPGASDSTGTAPRTTSVAELLWVLLPALMLAGALLLTWRAMATRTSLVDAVRETIVAQAAPVAPAAPGIRLAGVVPSVLLR